MWLGTTGPRVGTRGTASELGEDYTLARESCVKFERWEQSAANTARSHAPRLNPLLSGMHLAGIV
jgi:hypothetical protein